MNSKKWPLLIDPQFQGNSWLKKMFKDNKDQSFSAIKLQSSEMPGQNQKTGGKGNAAQQTLENSLRRGHVLLVEDMNEEVDPSLDEVVSQATFKEDGILKINMGDKSIDYDPNFKLFLTTKLANPHFMPEVTIKLTIINFTVTFDGLDE
jgi:dynein heavy chain